jgi:hypothetical protein
MGLTERMKDAGHNANAYLRCKLDSGTIGHLRYRASHLRNDQTGKVDGAALFEVGMIVATIGLWSYAIWNYVDKTLSLDRAIGELQVASTVMNPTDANTHLHNAEGHLARYNGNPSWFGWSPEADYNVAKHSIDNQQTALDTVIKQGYQPGTQEFAQAYDPIQDSIRNTKTSIDAAKGWEQTNSVAAFFGGIGTGVVAWITHSARD